MDKPETSTATTSKSHQNQPSQKHHQQNRPPRREFQSKSHSLNKRPISKPFQRDCDVYVSNKSNFQVNNIFVIQTLIYFDHQTLE